MGSPSLIPKIVEFTIPERPIGFAAGQFYLHFEVKDGCTKDVYAEKESGLATHQFIWENMCIVWSIQWNARIAVEFTFAWNLTNNYI